MHKSKPIDLSNNGGKLVGAKGAHPAALAAEQGHTARRGASGARLARGAERYLLVSVPPSRISFEKRTPVLRFLLTTPVLKQLTIEFFNLLRLAGNFCLGLSCGFFQQSHLILNKSDSLSEDGGRLNSGQGPDGALDGRDAGGGGDAHIDSPCVVSGGVGATDSTHCGNGQSDHKEPSHA